jgi:hypothetical protein
MSINNDANMLANFVNDSSSAKAQLRCRQKKVDGAGHACQEQLEALGIGRTGAGQLFSCAPYLGVQTG